MDCAVDEDAAILCCIPDEESRRVEQVAGLAPDQVRRPNKTLVDFLLRITVRGVEPARVAGHDFQLRLRLAHGHYSSSLYVHFTRELLPQNLSKRLRTSSSLKLSGFSQSTCKSFSMAAMLIEACVFVEVLTHTACRPL